MRRNCRPHPADCVGCGREYLKISNRQRNCLDCASNKADRARLRRYGVNASTWRRLVARFNGRCWICRSAPAICVDHRHQTGEVRGALCRTCNMVLHYMEDPEWQARACAYLAEEVVTDAPTA